MFSGLEPITVTSVSRDTNNKFTGYAYVQSDIVIGQEGYEAWAKAKDSHGFPKAQDGCYFAAVYDDQGWEVSNDYRGYCKIYYYQNGVRWAFSNSFADLVDTVRALGWTVTPNDALLDMWMPSPTFWQQLATFDTAVQEVSLLPRQAVLTANQEAGLNWVGSDHVVNQPDQERYEAGITEYIQSWVSRMLTILEHNESQLEIEVTGGRDSRTALSLALAAKQMARRDTSDRITVRSSKTQPIDLQVAENISSQFGLRINVPMERLGQGQIRLAPFNRWRQFGMGSYGPLSLPPMSLLSGVVKVGGHGGEGHRGYYNYENLQSPVRRHPQLRSDRVSEELSKSMGDTERILSVLYPGIDPVVAHYKEFRDRIHGGLHSMHQVRFQPLGSGLLEEAMRFSTQEAGERGQVLFDIISSTAPGLMMLRYETSAKFPSKTILDEIIRPLHIEPVEGKIFGKAMAQAKRDKGWATLIEKFNEADGLLPERALSAEVRRDARNLVNKLAKNEPMGHVRNAVPVHQVFMAQLAYGT